MLAAVIQFLQRKDWFSEMSLKVFLSYSTDPEEQVIVWRLQTLAAAHGIHVYVPHRQAFRFPSSRAPVWPEEVRSAIDQSDCVLAIVTAQTSPPVENELNYALGKRKLIIPIVEDAIEDGAFLKSFPRVFRFSKNGLPGQVEDQVVRFLQQRRMSKEKQQIVGALVGIGLGLLVLAKE